MEDLNVIGLVQFLKQHASNEYPHQRLVPGMAVRPLECTWREPATEQEVNAFAAEHGWHFPEDYKQLLLLHNGAILFQHPYYGGGTELLSLEKITIISKDCDLPAHKTQATSPRTPTTRLCSCWSCHENSMA
ncbi:SMI1/KNR4 family protein [Paenibacillus senegalensis]|uniref:SMI1/KNR4 family protein n=1 Tax=Paenibacillus senegalensis TaxID=1465766 RepID=UPI000289BB07|nr:SMI1/KNR4 family protein [Paenibacillus senegalensis]